MRIYVINLDRHAERMARIVPLLSGLDFERIKAVDGTALDGPQVRLIRPPTRFEDMTRYERACVASHVLALQCFLETGNSHACILEDDVILSPDFGQFMQSSAWMPANCDIMKIETFNQKVLIGRQRTPCLDRSAVPSHSLHLGSAGYVVNRAGAKRILKDASRPDQPMDRLLFDIHSPLTDVTICQLVPALCRQLQHEPNWTLTPEFQSAIQISGLVFARPKRRIWSKLARSMIRRLHRLCEIWRWCGLGYPWRVSRGVVEFR